VPSLRRGPFRAYRAASASPRSPCADRSGPANGRDRRYAGLQAQRSRNPCPWGPRSSWVCRDNLFGIRIGDLEPSQDLDLKAFHHLSVGLGLMIETQKMQQAVHHEMLEVVCKGNLLVASLALDRLERNHDIPERANLEFQPRLCERRGKREHVGGLVL